MILFKNKKEATMKKLTIFTIVIATAIMSHAASFSWKTSATGKIYQPGSTADTVASSIAYLFDSSSMTQAAILSAFSSGTLNFEKKLSSSTISSGKISETIFTDATESGNSLSAYFVAIIGEGANQKMFISDLATGTALEGKTSPFNFSAKTASQAVAKMAADGYSGSGWYVIPEPTSGLLMLLGIAGLALRRKQA